MTGAVTTGGDTRRHLALATLLLAPILAVDLVTFMGPMLNLATTSFHQSLPGGSIGPRLTFDNWSHLVEDSYVAEIVFRSIWVSLLISLLTLACAYPIAMYVNQAAGTWRTILFVLVISPLLTSAVVRTYSWVAILSDTGLVNSALAALGARQPARLIYNMTGVVIGLTEILMPYMILALLSGFGRLDPRCAEAARSLGARPWQVFWRVTLPLTAPGIALGCLLCFVLSVSSFITPKILGGGRVFLLATEIYDQAVVTLDWPGAGTLSILVLVIFGIALGLYSRAVRPMA